jgi:hypothetical protein
MWYAQTNRAEHGSFCVVHRHGSHRVQKMGPSIKAMSCDDDESRATGGDSVKRVVCDSSLLYASVYRWLPSLLLYDEQRTFY